MNPQPYSYNPYMPQPQYQQSYNPYMDRLQQLQAQQPMNFSQSPMPATNQFATIGKIVESIDIVRATDIPMDGNMYYFPKADGTEVYGKAWMSNGQTRILTFKPILDSEPNTNSSDGVKNQFEAFGEALEGIQSDLKTLSDKVDKLSKPVRQKGGNDE